LVPTGTVPLLAQMGLAAEIEVIRPGYPPAGQGTIRLAVPACQRPLRPLTPRRGKTPARVWGISLASHLDDRHVAARMAAAARTVLGTAGITAEIHELSDSTAAQPGAAFALSADFIGGTRLGADRAGAPHRPAEHIGARVARQLLAEVDSGATVDRYASDQIIPFASLCCGASLPADVRPACPGPWPLGGLVRAGHFRCVCEAREGAGPRALARETAVGGKAEKPDG